MNNFFKLNNILILCFLFCFSTIASSEVSSQKNSVNMKHILEHIQAFYVDEVNTQKLNSSAVDSVLKQLDPYSEYLDEQELEDLFNITNGHYTGLGIEVEIRDEHIVIISSISNSPAAQAGLKQGDILLSVNGQTVINKPIKQVASLISKTKKSAVNLSIARSGFSTPISFEVERQLIELETVNSELDRAGYVYLRIMSFNNHTLHDVARHIAKLKNENGLPLRGLLLDLRDNPGGILDSAVAVSDLFLRNGIIVSTKGRFYDANHTFTANNDDILNGAPIVVLINKGSASAAEILAGALKDNKRATIVGTRSYGKGSVQSLIPLGNGQTALKLTTAKYYTPSGVSIDGVGITPDIAIVQSSLSQSDKIAIMKQSQGKENQSFTADFSDIQLVKAQKILKQ
ncbi:S41 family peptidase [Pseudoalteromonas denitrificans]|uniref:Carboxyl-terminal processing protease n=1 Tax=Pseudoalteromonas denitrificans DSM 6059 TaxID=1123010 RepID=A0A1I1NY72_9GAMM|nr:S41 family peptidase [Pseudoalteromonas denitrificans]SFD02497.1 carboxyl-terminal processing protease [Pseudoalteromonas denitrificans DSM 6059]